VFELDGSRSSPEREDKSYLNVGRMTLRHCDVLIAIWDGEPAAGTGGTGQIVQEAVEQDIPTVWIRSEAPHLASLRTKGGEEEALDLPESGLGRRLLELLAPPRGHTLTFWEKVKRLLAPGPSHRDLREEYFKEKQPRANLPFFAWFTDLAAFRIPRTSLWSDVIERKTLEGVNPAVDLREFLQVHYEWADRLANHYASLYRSSFLMIYIMAATAVMLALSNLVWTTRHGATIAELVLMVTILILWFWGNLRNWHGRWVDYRILAECFRTSRFLAPLGRTPALPPPQPHDPAERDDTTTNWASWHFRAVMREAGLPRARCDDYYLAERAAEVDGDIKEQVDYHHGNSAKLGEVHEHLHLSDMLLFGLTLVACILHLVAPESWHERLSYCAAVFPAWAAAMAGILSQSEFYRNAERSQAMQKRLAAIPRARVTAAEPFLLNAIGARAAEAAEVMIRDLLGWRNIYRGKDLGLA